MSRPSLVSNAAAEEEGRRGRRVGVESEGKKKRKKNQGEPASTIPTNPPFARPTLKVRFPLLHPPAFSLLSRELRSLVDALCFEQRKGTRRSARDTWLGARIVVPWIFACRPTTTSRQLLLFVFFSSPERQHRRRDQGLQSHPARSGRSCKRPLRKRVIKAVLCGVGFGGPLKGRDGKPFSFNGTVSRRTN